MRLPPTAAGEEAPEEELPGPRVEPLEPAAGDPQRHDIRALGHDLRDPQPVAKRVHERDARREDESSARVDEVERAPVVRRDAVQRQLVPRRDLVEPARARCRHTPRGGPRTTTRSQPPADDHDRRDDDDDEERGADGGSDHPGIDAAASIVSRLVAERDVVEERVAPDAERDVREDEPDARVAVPAVHDRETVEAHQPLEPGEPREQQHLDRARGMPRGGL